MCCCLLSLPLLCCVVVQTVADVWMNKTSPCCELQFDMKAAKYADCSIHLCRFYLLFGLITAHYSVYNTQHIHHFYLGWSIALFAEFNHPLSAITLAISMGVFTQGVGVYGFASLFEDSSCFTASGGSPMSCDFTSSGSSAVSVRVCPQTSGLQHSCYYSTGL